MSEPAEGKSEGRFRWLAAALLGVAGLLLNLLPVDLSPGTDFIFGGIASLLAAVAFGPSRGLLAAAIASSPTILHWGHPYGFLVFCAEAVVVGWIVRRWRFRPLFADFIYWALLGVPLLFLTYGLILDFRGYAATLVFLKQALNGLVNALAVETLLLLPRVRRALHVPTRTGIRFTMAAVLALAAVVPVLVLGVWQGRQQWDHSVRRAEERARLASRAYGARVDLYVELHAHAVRALAGAIERGEPDDAARTQTLLDAIRADFPGFVNLYAADARAVTVAFSPTINARGDTLIGLSFRDREYFRRLSSTRQTVISDVFAGRGGVDAPLVVIAHPLIVADTLAGYVLGALELHAFPEPSAVVPPQRLRIADARGTLVYDTRTRYADGSRPTNLADSAVFRALRRTGPGGTVEYAPEGSRAAGAALGAHMLAGVAWIPTLGWWVWVEQPYAEIQRDATTSYVRMFILLVGASLAALLVSGILAEYMAAPLWRLRTTAASLAAGNLRARVGEVAPGAPLEIQELSRGFDEMADTIARRDREVRELAEAAQAASRAKTDFLATMSHELRTPLNAIVGHLDLMAMGIHGELSEAQAGAVDRVQIATRHLRGLIEEVLSFSTLEAGRTEVVMEDTDLCEMIREIGAIMEPLADEKGLRLVVECAPDAPPRVRTDADKVRQILINLAGNAVKFTEQGEVRLGVRPIDGAVELSVRDTGMGIAAPDRERLFQPFEQLDTGLSRSHGGTGLGLYLSGEYARLIGASIEIDSKPGKGSTFSLRIPTT